MERDDIETSIQDIINHHANEMHEIRYKGEAECVGVSVDDHLNDSGMYVGVATFAPKPGHRSGPPQRSVEVVIDKPDLDRLRFVLDDSLELTGKLERQEIHWYETTLFFTLEFILFVVFAMLTVLLIAFVGYLADTARVSANTASGSSSTSKVGPRMADAESKRFWQRQEDNIDVTYDIRRNL